MKIRCVDCKEHPCEECESRDKNVFTECRSGTLTPNFIENVITHYLGVPVIRVEEWVRDHIDITIPSRNFVGSCFCPKGDSSISIIFLERKSS